MVFEPVMPELPEVEFARRQWLRWMAEREVVRTEAEPRVRTFRGADPRAFAKLKGHLTDASRRGKYLLLTFEEGAALLHLGMTGKFVRRAAGQPELYSRARFILDDESVIHFRDPRLFGRIEPVSSKEALFELQPIRELGVDPLADGLTPAQLKEAVADSKQDLKVALMDQTRVAGLGNIHAAEALHRAGLHPARKPKTLKDEEWRKLARTIHQTLKFAIDHEHGDEIEYVEEPGAENPFQIYGRAGEVCRKCRTRIRSFTQGGRTTHYCPGCQPKRAPARRRS